MSRPQNLSSADKAVVKKFVDSFDTVLSDCDGVIHIGLKSIAQSEKAIEKLKKIGKKVHYVSNNCALSLKDFTKSLRQFGLEVNSDDITIPTIAIIDYLKTIGFKKAIYLIGLRKMREEFENAGFKLADYGPSEIEENIEQIIYELNDNKDVGAVIVDFDVNMTYLRLQKAYVYLKRSDVLFITAGSDNKIPFYNNTTLIGPSYFHNVLIGITGRQPMAFGKPGLKINEYVTSKYNLKANRTLFIGDSFSDVKFSQNGGYKSLMVLTGNVRKEDFDKSENSSLLPDFYVEKLGDMCKILDDLELIT